MSKLPILMYHNITDQVLKTNKLTIHVDLLEKQFKYLIKQGYQTHFLRDLENKETLNGKNIVITFDDVTKNQLIYAIPLLKKYKLKATFFIPFAYIGNLDAWNESTESIMSIAELKEIEPYFELGFHSYHHRKYADLADNQIDEDFKLCVKCIDDNQLRVHYSLAYPYGNFPKIEPAKSVFFNTLKSHKIIYGFRIGNRINKFPFANPYEINRIDVKGNESFFKFKFKIKFGKLF